MSDGQVDLADLDVAIAHWHINAWGGAEYLVTKLAEALDVETVHTIGEPSPEAANPYGDLEFLDVTRDLDLGPVRWIQRRFGRPAEYALWEDVDWREYGSPDVLVTSGATTRAVIVPEGTLHVNYCHSPPRWLWDLYHDRKGSLVGRLARPYLRYLRIRDVSVDPRVDRYFANSPVIQRRLQRFYDRESTLLYPPVDLDAYRDAGDEGFYLHVGRLDREKGVPAVVEAFTETDHELVLVGGDGDAGREVRGRIANAPNLSYRGFVEEETKRDLLSRCRAVVFNGCNEDFGIVPVEANASGKAVLARNQGFPGVFVSDGENGYRHDGSAEGIRDAVERFEREGVVDPRAAVEQFAVGTFRSRCRAKLGAWHEAFRLEGPH